MLVPGIVHTRYQVYTSIVPGSDTYGYQVPVPGYEYRYIPYIHTTRYMYSTVTYIYTGTGSVARGEGGVA